VAVFVEWRHKEIGPCIAILGLTFAAVSWAVKEDAGGSSQQERS
jgi:hypothetical protein